MGCKDCDKYKCKCSECERITFKKLEEIKKEVKEVKDISLDHISLWIEQQKLIGEAYKKFDCKLKDCSLKYKPRCCKPKCCKLKCPIKCLTKPCKCKRPESCDCDACKKNVNIDIEKQDVLVL
jgi:hypothetical protein